MYCAAHPKEQGREKPKHEPPVRSSALVLRLAQALNRIIEWNRQTAQDKYGDPEKAESWACVVEARAALRETPPNGPDQRPGESPKTL